MGGVKRKISEVEDVETQPIPSVKDLASSESRERRQALTTILSHLKDRSASSALTSTQCLQLWRGFHVAVYMHDSKNAISVQNVIATIANTFNLIRAKDEQNEAQSPASHNTSDVKGTGKVHSNKSGNENEAEFNGFNDENDTNDNADADTIEDKIDSSWLSIYTAAFWTTIIREWPTIDSHRMNKYLLLIRLVTRSLFHISIKTAISSTAQPTTQPASSKSPVQRNGKSSPKPASASSTSTLKSNLANDTTHDHNQASSPRHTPTQTQVDALIKAQTSLLSKYALNPRDFKIPNGLRIHMLDICVDELEKAISEESKSKNDDNDDDEESTLSKGPKVHADIKMSFKRVLERLAINGMDKNIRIKAKEELKEFESRIELGL